MAETSFQPDWFSKPGDTLLTLMEQRELSSEVLAQKLGCAETVIRGLLAGRVAIDSRIAAALSEHVGGTSKFWRMRQENYARSLSLAAEVIPKQAGEDWVKKFPRADMARNGWIKKARAREELMEAYLAYFGVNNPAEWEERYTDFLKGTAFRTSMAYQSKIGPLSAWLRQGEIEAARIQCDAWSPKGLRARLPELRVLCKAKSPSYFLPRIRQICSEVGVAVVFVRAPSGCTASGATRFVSNNKAMIVLSFRHLSDDHFWFTFFHETAHLLLHNEGRTFIEGDDYAANGMEEEANEFAERVLLPEDRRDELKDLRPSRGSIIRFAYSAGVSPGVVVGQMQHYGLIKQSHMNYLKRRFTWEQIEAAIG